MLKNSIFVIILFVISSILADDEEAIKLMELATIDQCEGNDSNNYSLVQKYSQNLLCNKETIPGPDYLITFKGKGGDKILNTLEILSSSFWPNGAKLIVEVLYLAVSGTLEGKYVYFKESILQDKYLKICSSVLGLSLAPTNDLELLISERLDPNVFISPRGAYVAFKPLATTVCRGRGADIQA